MQVERTDINDYFISYQGHGMIEKATKTNSIAHVINHENRHINEFKDYARFHNKEISQENITINYQFIDGKIVAVAGKATAVLKDKPPDENSVTEARQTKTVETPFNGESGKNISLDQKLDKISNRIESALAKIDSELSKIENSNSTDENALANPISELTPDNTALEAKKSELTTKLNQIKSEKLEKQSENILNDVAQLFADAANIMKAINGLKASNENNKNTDEYNKMNIPDYSTQYTGLLLDTMM
jgi:hypothetical protein